MQTGFDLLTKRILKSEGYIKQLSGIHRDSSNQLEGLHEKLGFAKATNSKQSNSSEEIRRLNEQLQTLREENVDLKSKSDFLIQEIQLKEE